MSSTAIDTPLPTATVAPAPHGGLSWSAAFGGAAVATAITIMLLALGAGIGLGSISPRTPGSNPSVATFTAVAAVWLIVVQWISSGFGGYLAGRLRPRWTGLHSTETGFRDTATGLVAWAVSTIVVVGAIASGVSSTLSGIGHAATGGGTSGPSSTLVSTLFRPATPAAINPLTYATQSVAKQEAAEVLASAGPEVKLSTADHDYLVQLVSARTGISADDATKRVDDTVAAERSAANAARKAASGFSLYSFFSMLVGAFIAAVAAAIGGKQRDMF